MLTAEPRFPIPGLLRSHLQWRASRKSRDLTSPAYTCVVNSHNCYCHRHRLDGLTDGLASGLSLLVVRVSDHLTTVAPCRSAWLSRFIDISDNRSCRSRYTTQLPSDQELLLLDSMTRLKQAVCWRPGFSAGQTYHSLVRSRPSTRSAPRPGRLANSGPFDRPSNINGPLHRTAYNGKSRALPDISAMKGLQLQTIFTHG